MEGEDEYELLDEDVPSTIREPELQAPGIKILPAVVQQPRKPSQTLSKKAKRAAKRAKRELETGIPIKMPKPPLRGQALLMSKLSKKIPDFNEPDTEYKTWPKERCKALFVRLRAIPLADLTRNICHKIAQLSVIVGETLDPVFEARRNALKKKKNKNNAAGTEPSSAAIPAPAPEPVAVSPEPTPVVVEKKTFDHIPDYNAPLGAYKSWPEERKMTFYSNLRAVPLNEMTRELCHKVMTIAGHLKITPDPPFLRVRSKFIYERRAKKNAAAKADSANRPETNDPKTMSPNVIAKAVPASIERRQSPPRPEPRPLRNIHPHPFSDPHRHGDFRDQQPHPLPVVHLQPPVRQQGFRTDIHQPMPFPFERPAQLQPPFPMERPFHDDRLHPQFRVEPPFHDVRLQQPFDRPFHHDDRLQPPHFPLERPFHDGHLQAPMPYVIPGHWENQQQAWPHPNPAPGPSSSHFSYDPPGGVPWNALPTDFHPGNRDRHHRLLPPRSPPRRRHSPSPPRRDRERHYHHSRSPSPKRRRTSPPRHRRSRSPPRPSSSGSRGRRDPSPRTSGRKSAEMNDLARSENYDLIPPQEKIETIHRVPNTIQEMQETADMVFLCQFRDAPPITKAFLHPASRAILSRLCSHLGPGFELKEAANSRNVSCAYGRLERTRNEVGVWINGMPRLLTLGEGVDPDIKYAMDFAYASCMAALSYMMIVPFQLFQVVQREGPEYVDTVLHSCKQRIRELIAMSREPLYGPLDAFKGGLSDVPQQLRDLWGNFINRMRHTGMEFWDSNIIIVPRGLPLFSGHEIDEFFFKCEHEDRKASWAGMIPIPREIIPFDQSEFSNTYPCSRFFLSPAENGLIPIPKAPLWADTPYSYHLNFKDPNVDPDKYDPILHFPFRDLLFSNGIGTRNSPWFTFFLLKYIGMRWKRSLTIQHSMEIDVRLGKERWKHVVTLSFQGVPYIFLGGKCRRDTFSSALLHAGAVIAEQLANMMIIPRELCYFLEKNGRPHAACVIYACRDRFATFEALVRHPMFASLHGVQSATLDLNNPLYKLAEAFFWRMRNSGFPYWVDHHRRLQIPTHFGQMPNLPEDSFFTFVPTYEPPNWDRINAPLGVVDNFDMSMLKSEDRMWTVWEGGDRAITDPSKEEPSMSELNGYGHTTTTPEMFLDQALCSDYDTPLAALSIAECSVVLNLIRSLAGTCKKKGLQMRTTRDIGPGGREFFHCDMMWGGNLSWILSASYQTDLERDLQFGAAWSMYKLLVKMAVVPPGLFKFIGNNEARLPYVVASLSPFFSLLESTLPQFMNHPDAENNRGLLMDHMRHLAIAEWKIRKIQLPMRLMPSEEEDRRLPFVRSTPMSSGEEQQWRFQGHKFQNLAKIVDERGRDLEKRVVKPQPGIKLSSKFSKAKAPPASRVQEGEDTDTDEELRQLEELCKGNGNARATTTIDDTDEYGEDEYL